MTTCPTPTSSSRNPSFSRLPTVKDKAEGGEEEEEESEATATLDVKAAAAAARKKWRSGDAMHHSQEKSRSSTPTSRRITHPQPHPMNYAAPLAGDGGSGGASSSASPSGSASTFMGSGAVNKVTRNLLFIQLNATQLTPNAYWQMMNMFRGRSSSSATAEDKKRLQQKVGRTIEWLECVRWGLESRSICVPSPGAGITFTASRRRSRVSRDARCQDGQLWEENFGCKNYSYYSENFTMLLTRSNLLIKSIALFILPISEPILAVLEFGN